MKNKYDLYFERCIGNLSVGWGFIYSTNKYYKIEKLGRLKENFEFTMETLPSDIYQIFELMEQIL